MKEEIIDGIRYRLDENNLTAEVIELKNDIQLDGEKLTVKQLMKAIFNGYKGDIIIPETVMFNKLSYRVDSIGAKAFAGSYSLKSVTIPNSVTSIGDWAFKDCSSLTTIAIPDYVTSIGEYAFSGCNSLISPVICGEEIIGGVKYLLYSNRTAKIIEKSGGYEGDIIIPETVVFNGLTYRVTCIGESAFKNCESLESIVIPDGVTSIGKSAFNFCFSLTSIVIPDSVKSIEENAFAYCESLESIVIPDGVTSIGKGAFENCEKVPSIIIPDNVKSIGDLAFSCCFSLTSIVISDGVTSIGYRAFESCSSLKSIVIPDSVKSIEENAFVGCTALTSIIVAEGNPIYDSRMNCNAIIETATNTLIRGCSQTIIPESITGIGDAAFEGCESLTSIIIPDSVECIGAEAFRLCESLKSITIPTNVKSVGSMAFDWCESLLSITYLGTIAQWKEIQLGFAWRNDVPAAAVVHCSDGDVSCY